MLCREIFAVSFQNRKKPVNTLCEQNLEMFECSTWWYTKESQGLKG
jgi:hypothetical protein